MLSDSKLQTPRHEDKDLVFTSFFLGFSPATAARYEAETGAERVAHLRKTILIGLIFYDLYQFTDMILVPDMVVVDFVMRVIVSLFSVGLVLVIPHVPAQIRELLVTGGMIVAYVLPVFLFWKTTSPIGTFLFCEMILMMVFATMMLVLRFPHAVAFAAVAAATTVLATVTKPDITADLVRFFHLQTATMVFFLLYGNYRIEAVRRSAYLTSLRETLRADELEVDRQTYAQLSETDALTGLANRRRLDDQLAGHDALDPAQRPAFGMLMIDVDHFKSFNDCYGHLVGDGCLRSVADALAQAIVPYRETAFRYGGEEFTVLVENADAADLEAAGERLRAAVADLAIPHAGRSDGLSIVTISLGGAICAQGCSRMARDIISTADQALYAAKRSGRNLCRIDGIEPREFPDNPLAATAERMRSALRPKPGKQALRAL